MEERKWRVQGWEEVGGCCREKIVTGDDKNGMVKDSGKGDVERQRQRAKKSGRVKR